MLFSKNKLLLPLGLGAAFGAPYLMSTKEPRPAAGPSALVESYADPRRPVELAPPPWEPQPQPIEGAPVQHFAEVLRFDVSPEWIMQRWPRVTAGVEEEGRQGYRVPLVTGTNVDDLAGSLTYYFGPQQKVDRITFRGATGDWQRLAALVVQQYGFAAKSTNDASERLFVFTHWGRTKSWLKIEPRPIVDASAAHARFTVALDMQRPPQLR